MSFTKFGQRLKSIGQKVTHGVRVIGSKISSVATRATPFLAAINPELGAAAAAVGGCCRGRRRYSRCCRDGTRWKSGGF